MLRFYVTIFAPDAPGDFVVIDSFGERAQSRVMDPFDALVTAAWLNQMWIDDRI